MFRDKALACLRLCAVAASLALAIPAVLAQTVNTATANLPAGTITINGSGFVDKGAPTVSLGGNTLAVQSYTDTSIVASLGSNTTPGTYLLEVTAKTNPLISI